MAQKTKSTKKEERRTNWGVFWAGASIFLAVAITLVSVMGYFSAGWTDWTFGFGEKQVVEDEPFGDRLLLTEVDVGNELMTLSYEVAVQSEDEAENYGEIIIAAEVTPDYAYDKTVTYSIHFQGCDDEEQIVQLKQCLEVTNPDGSTEEEKYDGKTIKIKCIKPFQTPIIVEAIANGSAPGNEVKAQMQLDFMRRFKGATICDAENPADEYFMLRDYESDDSSQVLGVNYEFGPGTVGGAENVYENDIFFTLTSEFYNALKQENNPYYDKYYRTDGEVTGFVNVSKNNFYPEYDTRYDLKFKYRSEFPDIWDYDPDDDSLGYDGYQFWVGYAAMKCTESGYAHFKIFMDFTYAFDVDHEYEISSNTLYGRFDTYIDPGSATGITVGPNHVF